MEERLIMPLIFPETALLGGWVKGRLCYTGAMQEKQPLPGRERRMGPLPFFLGLSHTHKGGPISHRWSCFFASFVGQNACAENGRAEALRKDPLRSKNSNVPSSSFRA